MLRGYWAAAVTPFNNGALDFGALEKYMAHVADSGVSGVVVGGSTGEALSLSLDEKIQLVSSASKAINGKIKVVAGVLEATTDGCLALMRSLEKYVDGFLCLCPYFLRASQEQIHQHLRKLSASTSRSIIIYNNPARTGSSVEFSTLLELTKLANVVGIKECSRDISVFTSWRLELKNDFAIFCGDDATAAGALALGAAGVISVSANVLPKTCIKLYNALQDSDVKTFARLRDALYPFHELMFAAPSPSPVKYALAQMGYMSEEVRAPLSPISRELSRGIDALLILLGGMESIK
ncbi:MAG: 4-hydroxy-tetrahydrodipicolinate synthase [Holosporaceae bacterium]|jgi:4-hydroxy-tetrahydrodipicolinate synthase|nr:4-hydroxy-tetrahydrodipicolinate synthase [Holosporaceae bacterium]